MNFPSLNEQIDIIKSGTVEIIPEDQLVKKIENSIQKKIPLNIKLGCDPSRPDLHLGHSVVLRKLRQFQDLGHNAILIIGDFTGMIGDPSGKNKTRPPLTLEETKQNGKSYFEQASKILLKEKTQILYNSDWLQKMNFSDVIKLASNYTIARMLERDDFTERFKSGTPISMHEFLYPLAQAMDSVSIKSDIELGGTDQKFNLLVGRDIQISYSQTPQVIITMPILVGTDGINKMSKSLNNYIGIDDSPKDMYGKILSIPDNLIYDYFLLTTDLNKIEIQKIKLELDNSNTNPRNLKRKLARQIVKQYYDEATGLKEEENFDAIFVRKEIPEIIEEYFCESLTNKNILEILLETNLTSSKSEARRLLSQGGISIDGEKIIDQNFFPNKKEFVIKVVKRKFLKIIS